MKWPPTEACAQRGSFLRACTKAVRLAIHLPRMQPTSAACVLRVRVWVRVRVRARVRVSVRVRVRVRVS